MRRWFFLVWLQTLSAQDYVCSTVDFRRMVANVRVKAEGYYSRVVDSSMKLSDTLIYSDRHRQFFPGVYGVEDISPCPNVSDQFALLGPDRLLGIHVLNRTTQGVDFTWDAIASELEFITPIASHLPTMLSHIPNASSMYVAGLTLNCSTFYFYPPRNVCGLLPMMDICSFYNARYNLFSKPEDLEADYKQGGHWSEVYTDSRQNLVITFSYPMKDATGNFRAQLGIGLSTQGVQDVIDNAKPSQNGHVFIISQFGHIIYAQQAAIDALFGTAAKLDLRKISSSYSGLLVRNVAITLHQSVTQFSQLPALVAATSTGLEYLPSNNSTNDGYYVAWSRFEETLKTWFMVGIIPKNEIDGAAMWKLSPSSVEVTLTDHEPQVQVSVVVSNSGVLPVSFSVRSNPHSQGIEINSTATRGYLIPNSSQTVGFIVKMDLNETPKDSFITHFITPFYTSSMGYGPCFDPQILEMVVRVIRTQHYHPSLWATTTIYLLCGVTGLLILSAFFLLYRYRFSAPVLALAPRICCFKLAGLLLILAASVANMLEPDPHTCEAPLWLFHLGFTTSAGAIAVKNYRTRRIFTSKKLQVVALTDLQLMVTLAIAVFVDALLLVVGTVTESYTIGHNGACVLEGRVVFGLLVATKVIVWLAAFLNTTKISNVPDTFADTRLNGILIVCAIMAILRLGLEFSGALDDNIGILLFLGSIFMWFGAFLAWGHFLLKLWSGYVTAARPRSSTKRGSMGSTSTSYSQPKLKERLEALLAEIEAQSTKLLMDKNHAIENVKANQRLLFEVRAELLAINTQAHLVDEELERFLPNSIKAAFDKHGPAMARRLDIRPAPCKPQPGTDEIAEEAKGLLAVESPMSSPLSTSPVSGAAAQVADKPSQWASLATADTNR